MNKLQEEIKKTKKAISQQRTEGQTDEEFFIYVKVKTTVSICESANILLDADRNRESLALMRSLRDVVVETAWVVEDTEKRMSRLAKKEIHSKLKFLKDVADNGDAFVGYEEKLDSALRQTEKEYADLSDVKSAPDMKTMSKDAGLYKLFLMTQWFLSQLTHATSEYYQHILQNDKNIPSTTKQSALFSVYLSELTNLLTSKS